MVWNWFKHWLGQIVYINSRPDSCSIHSYTESVCLSSSRYVYGCPAVCECAECSLLLCCIASSSISIVVWPRNSSKVQFKSNPQYTRSQQVSPTYENKHWTMLTTNMNLTAGKNVQWHDKDFNSVFSNVTYLPSHCFVFSLFLTFYFTLFVAIMFVCFFFLSTVSSYSLTRHCSILISDSSPRRHN